MEITGIDRITYGVENVAESRQFFSDWGLRLLAEDEHHALFATLNGGEVEVVELNQSRLPAAFEEGSTLREVIWGVDTPQALDYFASQLQNEPHFFDEMRDGVRYVGAVDPNGMHFAIRLSQKKAIDIECVPMNTWSDRARVNQRAPIYERAEPIEVGHVVFFVADVDKTSDFYIKKLNFNVSDSYPGRGSFLRSTATGGHHDLFLLQLPSAKSGLNHVAFTVRDIHEVFGGGMHVSRCGWETQLGPGRHPVSSAYFWYFQNPAGALVEYYADEDELTAEWEPREFTPSPTLFAEWAIDGGIDGDTRRQKDAVKPEGQFLTEKK